MDQLLEYIFVFVLGATTYSALEILFRGFTHWTMFFAGGISFTLLYRIFTGQKKFSLWINCFIGALIITGIELVFGVIFNLILGWNVWDYSHYPLDFMGQICLSYTLLWFLLSAPIFWLTKNLKKKINRIYL
jgi:uncharacterized membrane protein